MDYDVAKALKDSGCITMTLGCESGNDDILKKIGKYVTKDQLRTAAYAMRMAGLPFLATFILGHPWDTHDTIKETIEFANELEPAQAKFMIATPYPGTELFNMAKERGLLSDDGCENLGDHTYFRHVSANLSSVSDEDLLKYQQKAYDDYEGKVILLND